MDSVVYSFLRGESPDGIWVARDLRVPPTRIGQIVNERRAITPDTALRLARYFGTTAKFWMNLQSTYDLDRARTAMPRIEADLRPIAAAISGQGP
jgi:addiction module HigA family antidote